MTYRYCAANVGKLDIQGAHCAACVHRAYCSVDPESLHTGYIARRVAFLTGLNSLPAPSLKIPERRAIDSLIRLAARKMGWGHGPNRITEWGGDNVTTPFCYSVSPGRTLEMNWI